MLWLSAVLSYYLSSLYKHLFYIKQELSNQFHFFFFQLSVLTTMLEVRQVVPTQRWFTNQCAQLGAPKTHVLLIPQAQAGLTHHHPILGVQVPVQTWTPSPHSWVLDSVRWKDLHRLCLQSVGLKRAGSTTREQQVFPAPIPKYALEIINLWLAHDALCNDRSLIDTDREKA